MTRNRLKQIISLLLFCAVIPSTYGQKIAELQSFNFYASEFIFSVVYREYKDSVVMDKYSDTPSFCLCDSSDFFVDKKVISLAEATTLFPKKNTTIHSVELHLQDTIGTPTWVFRYKYAVKRAKFKSWYYRKSWKSAHIRKHKMIKLDARTGELIDKRKVKVLWLD